MRGGNFQWIVSECQWIETKLFELYKYKDNTDNLSHSEIF